VGFIFDVLLTVHLSIFISVINQLDAQIFFCFTISFISRLYMFRAHVLIIRRSKLHYIASGIITPIGGRLVHRLREEFISVINQLDAQNFCFTISLFHASTCFEHMCSKHVEA